MTLAEHRFADMVDSHGYRLGAYAMNRFKRQQIERNAESQDGWERAARHRERVMQLITDAATTAAPQICVFGAGNCNDLDLAQILRRFDEIHLVDADRGALTAAVARQGLSHSDSIHLHGDCDVTGIWSHLSAWTPDQSVDSSEIEHVLEAANCFEFEIPGEFDVTASICLLSQLIEPIVGSLGAQHPAFLDLLRIVRRRHVELLIETTIPGGTGLLITDIVSSDSAPQLPMIPEDQLPTALQQLVHAQNFFHGLNPGVIASLFQTDQRIAPRVDSVQILQPWLWDFGARHYAIMAFTFRRTGEARN